jgi:CRISPR-associated exonuclease Cas4
MEQLIQISKLNDFLYSPKSLYFHSVYESFDTQVYHDTPQVVGNANHENIDYSKYSSAKRYTQGLCVYSEKYKLIGKIDIFDTQNQALIERKTKIKHIYQGYKTQLYAQFFCLTEMGYTVERLFLHSLQDNKRYLVDLPNSEDLMQFESLISDINNYDVLSASQDWNTENKDSHTIYQELYF